MVRQNEAGKIGDRNTFGQSDFCTTRRPGAAWEPPRSAAVSEGPAAARVDALSRRNHPKTRGRHAAAAGAPHTAAVLYLVNQECSTQRSLLKSCPLKLW